MAVLREHVSRDFDYLPERTLRYFPDGPGGYSVKLMREGREMKTEPYKKCIILDFDDVVNAPDTPAPFKLYLDYLYETSGNFRHGMKDIISSVKNLESGGDVKTESGKISKLFRECGLSYASHIEAAEYAVENVVVAKNFQKSIDDIIDMGYSPFILSASPYEIVQTFRRRVSESIPIDNVDASQFYFDDDLKLIDIKVNLGDTRSSNRDDMMRRSVGTVNGVEIMVDDNQVTGKKIVKSGWNRSCFWLKESEPMFDNVSVSIPDVRKDFSILVDSMKKLERGISVTVSMEEEDYRRSLELANDIVELGKYSKSMEKKILDESKNIMSKAFKEYGKCMRGLFRYDGKLSLMVEDMLSEKNPELSRIKMDKAVEYFSSRSIESMLPRDLI